MTRTIVRLAATACGICVLGALPAAATDIRSELTPDLIYDHCRTAGVGSETEGTFMLPVGRRITGTVLCTAGDHDDEDDDDDDDDAREGYDA